MRMTLIFSTYSLKQKINSVQVLKVLSISLSIILLFSTLNTAFSQTTNSTDQCKTVMHEQIVQKKIDGKLRLQKIQVPMKICKDPNFVAKPIPPPIQKTLYEKTETDLKKMIYCGEKKIKVTISMRGAVPDFRPIKPSGEYYGMPELTQEQRNEVSAKSKAYVKELQTEIVKLIKDGGGTILNQGTYRNSLYAEIPFELLDDIEKRDDVIHIEGNKKMSLPRPIYKNSTESFPTIPEIIQKEKNAGKERLVVTIVPYTLQRNYPNYTNYILENGGIIKYENWGPYFIVDAPIAFVEKLMQHTDLRVSGVTNADSFDVCKWIKSKYA